MVITLTIAGLTKSFTISSQDTTRVLNANTAYYQRGRPGQVLTNQNIVDLIALDCVQMMKDRVQSEELTTAQAAISIPPVTTT